jgi:hypothetical protein
MMIVVVFFKNFVADRRKMNEKKMLQVIYLLSSMSYPLCLHSADFANRGEELNYRKSEI